MRTFRLAAAAVALLQVAVVASCSGATAAQEKAAAPPQQATTTPTTPQAAAPMPAPTEAAAPAGPVKAGDKAPSFRLPVAGGKEEVALDDAVAKSKLTVLMFIATECPVSNAYNDRMAKIASDYTAKGVAFYGINSNKQESVADIVAHAKQNGLSFRVLKDKDNVVADQFQARVTPEVYVVDPQGVVRYHGRIDERQADAAAAKSHDLTDALDALLQGQAPTHPETKAFGCSIKRI